MDEYPQEIQQRDSDKEWVPEQADWHGYQGKQNRSGGRARVLPFGEIKRRHHGNQEDSQIIKE